MISYMTYVHVHFWVWMWLGLVGDVYLLICFPQSIASMRQKLDDLHLLVQSGGVCVMVEGCGGCGKSALLKAYAKARGYSIGDNLVVVHLGEQIDGKVHGIVYYIAVKCSEMKVLGAGRSLW